MHLNGSAGLHGRKQGVEGAQALRHIQFRHRVLRDAGMGADKAPGIVTLGKVRVGDQGSINGLQGLVVMLRDEKGAPD